MYNRVCIARTGEKKKTASRGVIIVPVERYYIFFNILFTVKLNEDVGGGTAVIAWTSICICTYIIYIYADYCSTHYTKETHAPSEMLIEQPPRRATPCDSPVSRYCDRS